ncbi:MAG: gamma-glutamyl-gamma-aminobutyrate hydrolase family protein [Magnetococcus sp. DMHC-1]|nr:gamma-glutamyl-gamma-aminobutyrate hydrolase family protein [Magnetococcales bacterium]
MTCIAVTQRVDLHPATGERRDALDQRWVAFLRLCGILPLLLPNHAATALDLLQACRPQGILLTGGNTLAALQGDAPERDALEFALLPWARERHIPVLGVCRGMQVLMSHLGLTLQRVQGHVQPQQNIRIRGNWETVNSFHEFGFQIVDLAHDQKNSVFPLQTGKETLHVWAWAVDGVIKAIRHPAEPLCGIMWHPERITPFRHQDVVLFASVFGSHLQLKHDPVDQRHMENFNKSDRDQSRCM